MREYILTPHEREIVREFLETGKKLNGFRLLQLRMKRNIKALENDLRLINQVLAKSPEGCI